MFRIVRLIIGFVLLFCLLGATVHHNPYTDKSAPETLSLNSAALQLPLPLQVNLEYSENFGLLLQAELIKSLTPTTASALALTVGKKEYRGSLSFGHAFTDKTRVKMSVEDLVQDIVFDFDSGAEKRWEHQPAAGISYQYLVDDSLLENVSVTGYYAKAQSKTLGTKTYVHDQGLETNFRRIAGATSYGIAGAAAIKAADTSLFSLTANLDKTHYDTHYSHDPGKRGFGAGISYTQLLGQHFKLLLGASHRELYQVYQSELDWLLPFTQTGNLQLALKLNHLNAVPGQSADNRVRLGAIVNLGGKSSSHYSISQLGNQTLAQWTGIPAVHMSTVLARLDQKSVAGLASAYAGLSTDPYYPQQTGQLWSLFAYLNKDIGESLKINKCGLYTNPVPSHGKMTLSMTGLPPGLNFTVGADKACWDPDYQPGQIRGTPTMAGNYTVSLTAHNSASGQNDGTSQTFTIMVLDTSRPTIAAIPDQKPMVNHPFALNLHGFVTSSALENPLSITLPDLPSNTGLSYDPSTFILSGTPTQATLTTVTVNAHNKAGDADPVHFVLNIVPDAVPVINTITEQQATQNTPYRIDLSSFVVSDPDQAPLTITLAGLPSNTGLNYDNSTFVLEGTPTLVTNFTLTVNAHNRAGYASATKNFTLQINPDNRPVINPIPEQKTYVSEPYSLNLGQYVVSPSSDAPLSITINGLPDTSGLHYNPNTYTISGTPLTSTNYTVVVYAHNQAGESIKPQSFQLKVIEDERPVINPVPDQSVEVGTPFNLNLRAFVVSSSYEDPLVITLSGLNGDQDIHYDSHTFTLSGTPKTAKDYVLVVNAQNQAGHAKLAQTFHFTVTKKANTSIVCPSFTAISINNGNASTTVADSIGVNHAFAGKSQYKKTPYFSKAILNGKGLTCFYNAGPSSLPFQQTWILSSSIPGSANFSGNGLRGTCSSTDRHACQVEFQ